MDCVSEAKACCARPSSAWLRAFCASKICPAGPVICSALAISVAVAPAAPAYAMVSANEALVGDDSMLPAGCPAVSFW